MGQIAGSYPLPVMLLTGAGSKYFHVKGSSSPLISIGGLTLSVPAGVVVNVFITHNTQVADATLDESEWIQVGTNVTAQEFPYKTGSCMGIRVTWVSGSTAGTPGIRGEVTEFSGGGGGTASSPSVIQGPVPSGSTASGNPVPVAGVAHSTPRSFVAGQAAVLGTDLAGNLEVTLATELAMEDAPRRRGKVEQCFSSLRITTASTNTIISGQGTMGGFFLETSPTGNISFYDGVTAVGSPFLIIPAGFPVGYHQFPRALTLGLTVVTAGADRVVPLAY